MHLHMACSRLYWFISSYKKGEATQDIVSSLRALHMNKRFASTKVLKILTLKFLCEAPFYRIVYYYNNPSDICNLIMN